MTLSRPLPRPSDADPGGLIALTVADFADLKNMEPPPLFFTSQGGDLITISLDDTSLIDRLEMGDLYVWHRAPRLVDEGGGGGGYQIPTWNQDARSDAPDLRIG